MAISQQQGGQLAALQESLQFNDKAQAEQVLRDWQGRLKSLKDKLEQTEQAYLDIKVALEKMRHFWPVILIG